MPDLNARISACICGVPRSDASAGYPAIDEFLRWYRPWLTDDNTCVVRFEHLVGTSGGGATRNQEAQIAQVARHLRRNLHDDAIARVGQRLFSASSATFRRGTAGQWRSQFTDEHVAMFKASAADLLVEFGYEQDDSWGV